MEVKGQKCNEIKGLQYGVKPPKIALKSLILL